MIGYKVHKMLTPKKRGQISVEALVIVGVLVVGGVIFGAVYFNQLNEQAKKGSELSGLTDTFLDDFGYNGPPSTSTCNHNGVCNSGENSSNCPDDCPPSPNNCNYNGVCEPPLENENNCSDCTYPPDDCDDDGFCEDGENTDTCDDCLDATFTNFNLTLDNPPDSSPVNIRFSLKAQIKSGYPSVEIYNIRLMKFDPISYSWSNSKKCTINEVAPDAGGTYNMILSMEIENTPSQIHSKIIDGISCSEEGEYRFSAMARPKEISGVPSLSADVTKIITPASTGCGDPTVCDVVAGETCPTCPECCIPTPPSFSILITSPTEWQSFFNDQTIQLTAEDSNASNSGSLICEWYIGDTYVPANKYCNFSYDLRSIDPGEYKVTVSASKEVNGITLTSTDARNIMIFKHDNTAYLASPGMQYVGKEFNIIVSSSNQNAVSAVAPGNITFTGTTCSIASDRVSQVEEDINGTAVYYKLFPTTCTEANYTAQDTLGEVNAVLGGESTPFYVGYDTSLNFGACSVWASTYGQLTSCVLQTSGGGYNSDYWNNSYGLLKVTVDVSSGETTSDYGTLTVYVE